MHHHWMITNADTLRTLAQANRNRGYHTGAKATGHRFKRPMPEAQSWEALCLVARQSWRTTCNQARNDFATACLNGTAYGDYDDLQIH